jgi:hypothetical protein
MGYIGALYDKTCPDKINIGLNSPSVMGSIFTRLRIVFPITQHHFCHKTKKEYMKKVMLRTKDLDRKNI